jgi:hypothetical protein
MPNCLKKTVWKGGHWSVCPLCVRMPYGHNGTSHTPICQSPPVSGMAEMTIKEHIQRFSISKVSTNAIRLGKASMALMMNHGMCLSIQSRSRVIAMFQRVQCAI